MEGRTIGIARLPFLAGLAALAVAATGCGLTNYCSVTTEGRLGDTPEGRGAVLAVAVPEVGDPKVVGITAGWIDTPNPDSQFADLLAHAASQDGGLSVLLPYEVRQAVERADIDYTLRPTPEELAAAADALGCAYVLTAEVYEWDRAYSFFVSVTETRFSVTCLRADDGSVVWQGNGECRARGKTEREAARHALYDVFCALKESQAEAAPPDAGAGN